MRTLDKAIQFAQSKIGGPRVWRRLCLSFVRQCWGIPATGIPTAYEGWKLTKHRHTDGVPPRGALIWWKGPTPEGHVAISAGNGYCYSNDIDVSGGITKTKINTIAARWGAQWLGWTEDYPNAGKLPLEDSGSGAGGGGGDVPAFKVGDRVVVATPAGLKARLAPGTEKATDSGRTVAKGYRIKITKLAEEDGYTWAKADKYWYAVSRGYVRKIN